MPEIVTRAGLHQTFEYRNKDGKFETSKAPGFGASDRGPIALDGITYNYVALNKLQSGYATVPITLERAPGTEQKGCIIAGVFGKRITHGFPEGFEEAKMAREFALEQFRPNTTEPESDKASDSESSEKSHLESSVGEEGDVKRGRLARVFARLNCFGGTASRKSAPIPPKPDLPEKGHVEDQKKAPIPDTGHSTIQPLSGWFLVGPGTRAFRREDMPELDGPSVDAIKSCKEVVQYRV